MKGDSLAGFVTRQLTALMFLIIALTVFLFNLGHPAELVFDENHYVPAARAISALSLNNNPEHPLFAKEMIAAGIDIFGDTPFGWRFFGAVVSALGIYACFQIALRLFRSLPLAVLTATLLLTSITFTVQARTAMLDTYAYPLLAISVAWLMWSSGSDKPKLLVFVGLFIAGSVLGLAAGAKWIAGIYAMMALFGLVAVRIRATLSARRPAHEFLFGRGFRSWPDISLFTAGMVFGVSSLLVYFLTFLPTLFWSQNPLSVTDLLSFQFIMLDRQTMPLAGNAYESSWWEWPLMLEPIWYHFKTIEDGGHEAIFYVGNPVVYWGGLVGVLIAFIQGARRGYGPAIGVSIAFLASWLVFAILPKQIGFFFYYHGSAMLLCFAIPAALALVPDRRNRMIAISLTGAASILVLCYFLPVVLALEMPRDQWTSYVWLPDWS